MFLDLSSGEVIHIGAAVTLTVLAIEGDLVHFGLETLEGEGPGTDDFHASYDEDDFKQT